MSAQALAESTTLAEADAPTGQALDRIVLYLHGLSLFELHRHRKGVQDVFRLLSPERAQRSARWLVRHAHDPESAQYWRRFLMHAV